jgi:hypothetical protein
MVLEWLALMPFGAMRSNIQAGLGDKLADQHLSTVILKPLKAVDTTVCNAHTVSATTAAALPRAAAATHACTRSSLVYCVYSDTAVVDAYATRMLLLRSCS